MRKDPDFRLFLQESKLSENFVVKRSLGQRITATIDRWNNKTNKYARDIINNVFIDNKPIPFIFQGLNKHNCVRTNYK